MNITEQLKNKTALSFEVFPPKPDAPVDVIYQTLDEMKDLKPDFISVTYGAGGSAQNRKTFQIASDIQQKYGIESVAHLSCIGQTKEDVKLELRRCEELGIHNVLALRGDPPADGVLPQGEFRYASELVSFIREQGDFHILAACYPEGHTECESIEADIRHLKTKVDAGVDHLITQLFLDNNYYYSFMDRAQAVGISVPVEAGIMPVTNQKQMKRMSSLCGATVPKKFKAIMERYGDDPIAMRDAGIAYAIDQIVDLITMGASGIHLYTMNNAYVARKIYDAVHNLFDNRRDKVS